MARNGWLCRKFYRKYTVKEFFEYLKEYTTLTDIFIEEFGLYTRLPDEIKREVQDKHINYLSSYDDEWAYAVLSSKSKYD